MHDLRKSGWNLLGLKDSQMALIACVVYDPPGEPRTTLMVGALRSIAQTANNHRLVIVSNGISLTSHEAIKDLKYSYGLKYHLIETGSNIGTARAISRAWQLREPGEHCLKVDSDVLIHERGWLDKLEECIGRDPQIGIIGLKRKDCDENPWAPEGDWSQSKLHMLPHLHKSGATWLIVEKVHHVMGTCQLYNSALLDKIGYLVQMGKYGFDDSLAAVRCEVAGFYSCFYPHYNIDHPDPGGSRYQSWKEKYSGERMDRFRMYANKYRSGEMKVYHGPDEDLD